MCSSSVLELVDSFSFWSLRFLYHPQDTTRQLSLPLDHWSLHSSSSLACRKTPCVPCDHLYKETTYGSSFPCSLCPRIPGHQKVTKSRDIKKSVPLDLLHHPCRLTLTSPSNRILPLLENVLRGPTVSPVHPALGCGKSVPQVCA